MSGTLSCHLTFSSFPEAAEVETIELFCLPLVDSPSLAFVEHGREDLSCLSEEITAALTFSLAELSVLNSGWLEAPGVTR